VNFVIGEQRSPIIPIQSINKANLECIGFADAQRQAAGLHANHNFTGGYGIRLSIDQGIPSGVRKRWPKLCLGSAAGAKPRQSTFLHLLTMVIS
jgi:hypothetical protein